MNSKKCIARKAGMFYLLMAIFYIFSMMYVDSTFYVRGDTPATIHNLNNNSSTFIMGIMSSLLGHLSFIMVVNYLYKLFSAIQKDWARLMQLFVITGVSIAFINSVHQLAAIILLNNPTDFISFNTPQLHSLIMLFLEIHETGAVLSMIFWGLWLIPLGLLIIKSNMMPKLLAGALILTGVTYLFDVYQFFFIHEPLAIIETFTTILGVTCEIALMLWLIVKGVKKEFKDAPIT